MDLEQPVILLEPDQPLPGSPEAEEVAKRAATVFPLAYYDGLAKQRRSCVDAVRLSFDVIEQFEALIYRESSELTAAENELITAESNEFGQPILSVRTKIGSDDSASAEVFRKIFGDFNNLDFTLDDPLESGERFLSSAIYDSSSEHLYAASFLDVENDFLIEGCGSGRVRFFENFEAAYPGSSILRKGIIDNFGPRIHGFAQKNDLGEWIYYHIFQPNGCPEEFVKRLVHDGLKAVQGDVKIILKRSEADCRAERRRAFRAERIRVAETIDHARQEQPRVYPISNTSVSIINRLVARFKVEPDTIPDPWGPLRYGWTERFSPELSQAVYAFCIEYELNIQELSHLVGALAAYDKRQLRLMGLSIAAAMDGAEDRNLTPEGLQELGVKVARQDVCVLAFLKRFCTGGVLTLDKFDYSDFLSQIIELRKSHLSEISPDFSFDEFQKIRNIPFSTSERMRFTISDVLLNFDYNVDGRLICLNNKYIMGLLSLCVFGDFINSRDYNERVSFVRGLLERALEPVFKEIGCDGASHSGLIDEMAERLVGERKVVEGVSYRWRNKVSDRAIEVRPLPEDAPALWKEVWEPASKGKSLNSLGETLAAFEQRRSQERSPKDTPVTFIRRHYSRWLGPEGRGVCGELALSRPDIRRLDPELDVYVRNWLKKNSFPEDFDLPTKKEMTERRAAAAGMGANPSDPQSLLMSEESVRAYRALSQRKLRER